MRIYQQCSNAVGWTVVAVPSASEEGLVHMVTLAEWGEYLCDCPGFQFRGICRHKAEAESHRCRWEEGEAPCQSVGERETHRCPACGSPTILVAEVEDGDK